MDESTIKNGSMTSSKKVSVVFATDVVGYSRMMAENEARTLALLERARDFIDRQIIQNNGRIANTAGDSVIAVFESATVALKCALTIQKALKKQNDRFSESKKLQFRIGLHMGEIYMRGRDVLGAGVNIAARLEAAASPGAVCVSETFWSFVDHSEVDEPYAQLGELELKNITVPVKAIEFLSKKALTEHIEVTQSKILGMQRHKVIVVSSAIGAVSVAVILALIVSFNLSKVAEMGMKNSPSGAASQTEADDLEVLPFLPPTSR